MGDIFTGSPLEHIGSETILQFIQKTVSKYDNVEHVLENIPAKRKEEKEEHVVSVKEEGDAEPRQITASAKGFYYERLWDICIKFGVTDLTLGTTSDEKHQTTHIFDNSNKESIKVNENCWSGNKLTEFLSQKVRSGNSGGYSDITFVNKAHSEQSDEEVYFISVKYFKKEKDIGEYDIGKLCTLIREHEKKHRTIKLYICVNNKKEAIEKFEKQHRSSAILLKYINPGGKYEHVYDTEDLRQVYFNLRKLLEQYNYLKKGEDVERFNTEYLKTLKAAFVPRFHQKLFISKINELIDTDKRHMLVGAIPRSGKSYIMAGTILEYVKKHARAGGKKMNFLLMTPAPNETFPEYKSIFNNYIDFDKNQIETKLYNEQGLTPAADKHTVHIISKQRLGYIESEDADAGDANAKMTDEEYIQKIRENFIKIFKDIPHFDIIFLDEAHFGMSTTRAQKIVGELTRTFDKHKNTTQIYVTATYRRPLKEYKVTDDCKMTWDLTDIEVMKHLGESKYPIKGNKIEKQFGSKIYTDTLKYYGDEKGDSIALKLKKDYEKYPKPYLLTPLWDKEFVKVEKSKIGNTEFGWSMDNLFSTKGGSFENIEQVKEMMRYYFGYPNKEKNYEEQSFYRTRGIIPRIRNICANECRTQQQKHKTTQLWFLPVGTGRIQDKITSLITILTDVSEFKDIANTYHFYAAVEVERPVDSEYVTYMKEPKKIKKEIEELEQVLRGEKGKRKISGDNLIILAGQRLQLGISLRNVDIVTLWNSIKSSDAIFQMLFRSMTEVDGPKCDGEGGDGGTKKKREDYCGEKKFGFMVDMDPQRALINVSLFSDITAKSKPDEETQHYKEITDLINIDKDVLHDRFGDDDAGRKKFVNDLFEKLYSSWNQTVENTKEIIGKFELDMDKLDKLKEQLKRIYTDKSKKTDDVVSGPDDASKFDKKNTREKEGESGDQAEPAKKKGKKAKPEIEINIKEKATEIISEYVSLLNIFTLYRDDGTTCILSDTSKENSKAKVITDIRKLKDIVFENDRDIFLQILKGRLTGNNDGFEDIDIYENLINEILDTISDDSDNLTINKISMIQKKKYYTIHEPDELLEYINQNIKPKEQERKENGEVFTPLWLVKQMLDELDNAYIKETGRSIFSEKDFKWLDPAVGIGNFPIIVYQRLMGKKDENGKWEGGLSLAFPDEEERRKHILENMLYMVEISSKSIYILNKIFCGKVDTENERDSGYRLNIHDGSFLNGSCKYDFMFDVVMGNPPYNPPKTATGSSGNNIWPQFVIKSYYLLKDHGFLLFIHPPGWKKPTDDEFKPEKLEIQNAEYYNYDKKTGKQSSIKQIRQGQVWSLFKVNGVFHFIYTNDQKDKKIKEYYIPYFPAVDYYVYQKNGISSVTCSSKNVFAGEIKESKNVKINYGLKYLPNLITNETLNVLHKVTSKDGVKPAFKRYRDSSGFSLDPDEGKYKYIYTFNKKNEEKFQYSNKEAENLNKDKVIMNFDGGIDCYTVKFVKKEDQIGSYDKSMYLEVTSRSEGERIEKFFKSDIVKFIFLITQYGSGQRTQNEPIVANSITIPSEEEKDYYKFFGIEDDKKYIEDALSRYYKKTTPLKESKETEKSVTIAAAAEDDDDDATDDDDDPAAPSRHLGPGYGHDKHVSTAESKKKGQKKKEKREKIPSSTGTKKITKVASKSSKADSVDTGAAAETPTKKGKSAKKAKSSIKAKAGGSKQNRSRTLKKRKRN